MFRYIGSITFFLYLLNCREQNYSYDIFHNLKIEDTASGNPIIPGYFSDPDLIEFEGKYYLYSTIDPWGSFEIAVWETDDFRTWWLRRINWPTRDLCTSTNSDGSMISAPSVVRDINGKFYMYITAGGEIWAGISDHPLGPWYNINKDNQPMIKNLPGSTFYNIGAECFIDDDNRAYLYWGSGLNWINGHCYAVMLAPDMYSFASEPIDITPNYFKSPSVVKISNHYYMFYSDGRCIDSTYKIRYAISNNPLGVWEEGKNSPILKSMTKNELIGPGHPSVFQCNGEYYLLYDRIERLELDNLLRQICIDSLNFDEEGYVHSIKPLNKGVNYFLPEGSLCNVNLAGKKPIMATSELSEKYKAEAITDMKAGTLWVAADSSDESSFTIDLGENTAFMNIYTWFEYPFWVYHYFIEYSSDSLRWDVFAVNLEGEERGAPRIDSKPVKGRYIRLTIHRDERANLRPAVWEVMIE